MATAYAALVSLINTIALDRTSRSFPFDETLIDALLDKVESLVKFLEQGWKGAEHLEGRITDLAYAAEDAIESSIVDTILARSESSSNDKGSIPTCQGHDKKKISCIGFLEQCWKGAEHLEGRTANSTHAAEDATESSTVDTILSGSASCSNEKGCVLSGHQDLGAIVDHLDSIKEEIMQIQNSSADMEVQPGSSGFVIGSSSAPHDEKNKMVGFEKKMEQIKEELERGSKLQAISIVGMGGIGKTTLARSIYDDKRVAQHFDVRAWVMVSQEYDVEKMYKEVLSCLKDHDRDQMDEAHLGEAMYKSLFGRRYLVILDDIWDIDAWDNLRRFFPDSSNGSRIIFTTRHSNLANDASTCTFGMKPLDEENSWKLLCEEVFGQESCPVELEKDGKKVSENCGGLPLAIVVIGGFLKSNLSPEFWNRVAQDLSSYLNGDDNFSKILSLSYKHLPVHLKPCFLYMGVFPEDHKISITELTNLWIAEGFLKSHGENFFEEIAEEYLKDLIERNLIMVREREFNGKVMYCNIHDLLRDLCIEEAHKASFFRVVTKTSPSVPPTLHQQRRLVIRPKSVRCIDSIIQYCLPSRSRVRSLILNFHESYLNLHESRFRLLRILFVIDEEIERWGSPIACVNLRCFMSTRDLWGSENASNTRSLRNMQVLKLSILPHEVSNVNIWDWRRVRHVELSFSVPRPPCLQEDNTILENLQIIEGVTNFKFDEASYKRIPNVKKLSISYNKSACRFMMHNLARLENLESVSLTFCSRGPRYCCTQHGLYNHLRIVAFPHSLKELYLKNSKCSWEDMSMIGSLPNLEVLSLFECSFWGEEWNPVEGEFLRLEVLEINGVGDLIYWNADETHFPVLKKLSLHDIHKLKRIPLDIGKITTLQLIELVYCRDSIVISAKKIMKEQEDFGNDTLAVEVECYQRSLFDDFEAENFRFRKIIKVYKARFNDERYKKVIGMRERSDDEEDSSDDYDEEE